MSFVRRNSTSLGIALLVLVVAAPVFHRVGGQQLSRYATTAAMWDHGNLDLTPYTEMLRRDAAIVGETVRPDKAPLQPLVAVPFYGLYRVAGGEPAEDQRGFFSAGIWWLTLWTAAVPAAALAGLMHWFVSSRLSASATKHRPVSAAVSLSFGTLLLPFATLLYGHVMAALLLFGAFILIDDEDAGARKLAAAGVLAGAAVLTEYPVALIAVVFSVGAAVRFRTRVWPFVLGAVPCAIALMVYNATLFGSPFTFSYQYSAWNVGFGSDPEAVASMLGEFSFGRLIDVLFNARGLVVATPVVAVAIAALLATVRWQPFRAWTALGTFSSLLVLNSYWANSFAGGPGPRYVAPALPFLIVGAAEAWRRWRLLAAGSAALSVLTMMAATFTEPQLPSESAAGLGFWLKQVFTGGVVDTIFTREFGGAGWVLHGLLVLAAVWVLARSRGTEADVHAEKHRPSMASVER